MQYSVQFPFDVDVICHILLDEEESLVAEEVSDVIGRARYEVIHRYHLVPLFEKPIAKVRAYEASPTCDQNPHLEILDIKKR
jgi:hypothetical protein